jgi:hypothetical protein
MSDEGFKQLNVYLPAGLIKQLKHHAIEAEMSLSSIVTEALRDYLGTHATQPRSPERGPGPAVEVVSGFEDTHFGTREMTVRDPDGRPWVVQAPVKD